MSSKPQALLPGASKRLEALSDGVFAIACTILVLEIRVPGLPKNFTKEQLWHSMEEILPSFVAFVFSFLNILVFWVNHDAIGKVTRHYDYKTTYLNILFLLFISLIPFTTAFVSEYPFSFTAVTCYGAVLLLGSVVAIIMYDHIAFKAKLMVHSVTMESRKRIRKRAIMGPPLYALAILLGLIHVAIPIVIYAATPVLFMFLPELDFAEEEA